MCHLNLGILRGKVCILGEETKSAGTLVHELTVKQKCREVRDFCVVHLNRDCETVLKTE